jgi:hypothetical protein
MNSRLIGVPEARGQVTTRQKEPRAVSADPRFWATDVRFGSLADISDVRLASAFPPIADIQRGRRDVR